METMLTGAAPQAVPADLIKDSDQTKFAKDVIEASRTVPVIVDFWAPWCGPCKTLQPMIEKVVKEAKGAVKLVKIDIDKNQMLAQQLRIQSIPAVYAFFGGRPVDGFMGAVPESQVKAFVDKLVQAAGGAATGNEVAELLEHAKAAVAQNDNDTAAQIFSEILGIDPENVPALAGHRMIGMVQPLQPGGFAGDGLPTDDGRPKVHRIGCAGRIVSFNETEDGRLLLALSGVCRFEIVRELDLAHGGYRRVSSVFSLSRRPRPCRRRGRARP